jgi:diaminohydroxyphosphoribosylaminopyrimidine deaminase/5-amino-6-(5-phosphoribosylamino)uracil reductase
MSASFDQQDHRYMRRALQLAARGRGMVEPNPMVGCVLAKDGKVVGEGYHHQFGGPHAEVHALRSAGDAARGSTAYVTLEPCCHHGKTPPCTEALIAAGVTRVVAAMKDPGRHVTGKGFTGLKDAGIEVQVGLCEDEARILTAPYVKRIVAQQPWVILKWAQSLDGKIATSTGDSQWISCPRSRKLVHRVRGQVDAILVGIGTVVRDDPELTCRDARLRRVAARIVLDPNLRIPMQARLISTARAAPTIIVTTEKLATEPRARDFSALGVEVVGVPVEDRQLSLRALLDELGARGMSNLLVEGGGDTIGRFIEANQADEALVFVSPILIGGQGAPGPIGGSGSERVADACKPVRMQRRRVDVDTLYRLQLKPLPQSSDAD